MSKLAVLVAFVFFGLLTGCANEDSLAELSPFYDEVASNQLGYGKDQWIELRNLAGEWERTGLIFGYGDDLEECEKAVAGLREANTARQYRCVPAQP